MDSPQRSWMEEPRITKTEDPNSRRYIIDMSAMRSDGVPFRLWRKLPPGTDLTAMMAEFNTFLDPACACTVGNNCELHKDWEGERHNS